MMIHELICKRMVTNIAGDRIEDKVVGANEEWSIEHAGRLIIRKEAVFIYDGRVVTDLAMLPEC